jgi:hypothetical protein
VHIHQGLLDAYAQSLQNVKLHGPTNMAEVIRRANLIATETRKNVGVVNATRTKKHVLAWRSCLFTCIAPLTHLNQLDVTDPTSSAHTVHFASLTHFISVAWRPVANVCICTVKNLSQFQTYMHVDILAGVPRAADPDRRRYFRYLSLLIFNMCVHARHIHGT